MTEQNIDDTAPVDTVATESQETQEQAKTFTQEDVDRIIANRLKQVERKYEGVDLDEYNTLKTAQQEAERKQMIKKEKFEELLQQQKSEYENRIGAMQSELQKTHIDGALLNAASKHKAVNPEHVAQLLKDQVRLNNGQVEVLDSDGQVRYNTDTAQAYTVEDAVSEFLQTNPYFRQAQPAGGGANGNTNPAASREVTASDFDMNDPAQRAKYAEWRKNKGIQ